MLIKLTAGGGSQTISWVKRYRDPTDRWVSTVKEKTKEPFNRIDCEKMVQQSQLGAHVQSPVNELVKEEERKKGKKPFLKADVF